MPGLVYETCADSDLILHAGDIEDQGTINDLLRFAPVKAVKGNMDYAPFPESLSLKLEDFTICMSHGSGPYHNVRQRLRKKLQFQKPDIIIHGHTHIFHWGEEHGIKFLCPGAVSNPIGNRSMAILTLEKGKTPKVEQIVF